MAISTAFLASLLAPLLLLHLVCSAQHLQVIKTPAEAPLAEEIDCDTECDRRCALSSRLKICKRACGTCCERCGCVPPGTSGHYDVCPCYANMTTHGGRHKCP